MADVNDLPDNIEGGQSGHTSAHETIHQVLKVIAAQVTAMQTALDGLEGGGSTINDNVTATDSTWSSSKIAQGVGGISNGLVELNSRVDGIINDDTESEPSATSTFSAQYLAMAMGNMHEHLSGEDEATNKRIDGIINDDTENPPSETSTFSAKFLSDGMGNMNDYFTSNDEAINKRIDDLDTFVMLNETNEWFNVATNEVVPAPKEGGLQEAAYNAYMLGVLNSPVATETVNLIPGEITVGESLEKHGIMKMPNDEVNRAFRGLNSFYVYAVTLDTPSTSGPVVFRIQTAEPGGGITFTQDITIPEGETTIMINNDQYRCSVWQDNTVAVANVSQAGTGASGLTVRITRN